MLAEEEQNACIAVGAKLRSRPRLNQSGPLTGQQYWVRKDSAHAKVKVKGPKAKTGFFAVSSGIRSGASGACPR